MGILSLFTGGITTEIKFGLIAAAIAAAVTLFLWHDHKIRVEALQDFNNKQMEQTIQDRQKNDETLKKIQDSVEEIGKTQADQNKSVDGASGAAEDKIGSAPRAAQDKPASDLLRDTVRSLETIR